MFEKRILNESEDSLKVLKQKANRDGLQMVFFLGVGGKNFTVPNKSAFSHLFLPFKRIELKFHMHNTLDK